MTGSFFSGSDLMLLQELQGQMQKLNERLTKIDKTLAEATDRITALEKRIKKGEIRHGQIQHGFDKPGAKQWICATKDQGLG